MAGRPSSFTGIVAIAGLLATLVTHLEPVARSARVVAEEAAPAIRQVAEHAPDALQVVTSLPTTRPEESVAPPSEPMALNTAVTSITSPSPSPHPIDQDLQRELAIEEAQRGSVASPVAVAVATASQPATMPSAVAPTSSIDPRPMSVPQVRRCLDYKAAVAKAVEQALSAKATLDAERTLLLARDTELSSALDDDGGQDPGEHLAVQVQADQLRADVAAHDRKVVEVRRLAYTARDLGDRYNRTCSGRKYSDQTYQATLQLQTTSTEPRTAP